MKRNFYFALFIALALLIIFVASCATKQPAFSRAVVMGEANVRAQPDTAVLILSVVTQGGQAVNAQQENARKSEAVKRAVQTAAGANPEIKTSDYSLEPQRSYRQNKLPTIIGYEARNTVTVTMSDLDKVGAAIDAASQAGANSVENVSFILRENNPARGQTLADATRQAMTKAQSMAQALGGRIVRVVEMQEGGTTNRPLTTDSLDYTDTRASASMSSMSVAKRAYATPVESGSLNVKSQVQLVVEIEAKP
jgi:uncharacterized protein YggE